MNRDSDSKSHFLKNLESEVQFIFELTHFVNLTMNLESRFKNFEDSKKDSKIESRLKNG